MVCTLCSCVMQTKRIWLFSAHFLPLMARLCLVPLETIVFINRFSMIFTGLEVIYFLATNLLVPYNLAKTAYRELAQVIIYQWSSSPEICSVFDISLQQSLLFCFCICFLSGGRSVWPACFRHVPVEPAGSSSSLHVFLARALCSADLHLLQHQRPAYLKGEAPIPLSYKVRQ